MCHRPVWLDLGGIAKGYAIDRAIGALAGAGCSAGLVNAGGDLRVFGACSETILLRRSGSVCEPLVLQSSALAASDREAPGRPSEHRGYYRRGGRGATRRYAAVLAPEAAIADALTKCVLLGTNAQAAHALQAFGAVEVTGVLDSAAAKPHLRRLRD
jgi:thiamine biosynthesis lipoprotein